MQSIWIGLKSAKDQDQGNDHGLASEGSQFGEKGQHPDSGFAFPTPRIHSLWMQELLARGNVALPYEKVRHMALDDSPNRMGIRKQGGLQGQADRAPWVR